MRLEVCALLPHVSLQALPARRSLGGPRVDGSVGEPGARGAAGEGVDAAGPWEPGNLPSPRTSGSAGFQLSSFSRGPRGPAGARRAGAAASPTTGPAFLLFEIAGEVQRHHSADIDAEDSTSHNVIPRTRKFAGPSKSLDAARPGILRFLGAPGRCERLDARGRARTQTGQSE